MRNVRRRRPEPRVANPVNRWRRTGWLLYLVGYCLMAGNHPDLGLAAFAVACSAIGGAAVGRCPLRLSRSASDIGAVRGKPPPGGGDHVRHLEHPYLQPLQIAISGLAPPAGVWPLHLRERHLRRNPQPARIARRRKQLKFIYYVTVPILIKTLKLMHKTNPGQR
jgi:hypothetical protein